MKPISLSLSLLALLTLVGCPKDYSFESQMPRLSEGYCEFRGNMGVGDETLAYNAMINHVNELESGELGYVYTVRRRELVQYGRDKSSWGYWIEYDCFGAEVKVFISAPIAIANVGAEEEALLTTLRAGGNEILDIERDEIYTDQGIFVILHIYYYHPNENSTQQSLISAFEDLQSLDRVGLGPKNMKAVLRIARDLAPSAVVTGSDGSAKKRAARDKQILRSFFQGWIGALEYQQARTMENAVELLRARGIRVERVVAATPDNSRMDWSTLRVREAESE